MPLELESCFYQLAPGKIGFIIIHHFVKVARTIMTRLSEVLTVACCITERWCKAAISQIFWTKKLDVQRVGHLPKVTQLATGRARIQAPVVWFQSLGS